MVLFRGIADDLSLADWLEKHILPAEAKNVTADFVEWGTRLACLEMIRSGTTTYADMYYFEDQVAEVTAQAGMRGVLGETILQHAAPDNKTPRDGLAYTEDFITRWKPDRLIIPAVAPHAPYTNSAESLIACKSLADQYDVPMMIHVSNTGRNEADQGKIRETPTQWLEPWDSRTQVLFHHGMADEEDCHRQGTGEHFAQRKAT
jgi:5-methylthioadenosine/S-adenosylhomocysteine deaminase